MITRHRTPSGENHDVDHGPGPVGRMVRSWQNNPVGAVPLTEAMGMVRLGLYPQTARKKAYRREWEAKRR